MANYSKLKTDIKAVIKQNGRQEITGQILQDALVSIISSVGKYSQYAGIATPSTNPGVPDQNIFYLATKAGTYTNFGGIKVEPGESVILSWNGTWSKTISGFATEENLENAVNDLQTNLDEASTELQNQITDIVNKNGIYNVNAYKVPGAFLTPTDARNAVPEAIRKPGLIITYQTAKDTTVTEQYVGTDKGQWTDENLWLPVAGAGGEFYKYNYMFNSKGELYQSYTPYMPVKKGDKIVVRVEYNGPGALKLYNAQKEEIKVLLEYIEQNQTHYLTIEDENAAYVRSRILNGGYNENPDYAYPLLVNLSDAGILWQNYVSDELFKESGYLKKYTTDNNNMLYTVSTQGSNNIYEYNKNGETIVTVRKGAGTYSRQIGINYNKIHTLTTFNPQKEVYVYIADVELLEGENVQINFPLEGYLKWKFQKVGDKHQIVMAAQTVFDLLVPDKDCKLKFTNQFLGLFDIEFLKLNSYVTESGYKQLDLAINYYPTILYNKFGADLKTAQIAINLKKDFVFTTLKKIAVLGDSILSPNWNVFNLINAYLGIPVNNLAVGFSFPLENFNGNVDQYCNLRDEQLAKLTADTDVLVISGGQNRWVTSEDKTIANMDRGNSIGAINYTIQYMRNLNPKCVIFLCPTDVNNQGSEIQKLIHDDYRILANINDVYLIPLDEMLNYKYDYTARQLRADNIHPTWTYGAMRFAACIISEITKYIK